MNADVNTEGSAARDDIESFHRGAGACKSRLIPDGDAIANIM